MSMIIQNDSKIDDHQALLIVISIVKTGRSSDGLYPCMLFNYTGVKVFCTKTGKGKDKFIIQDMKGEQLNGMD